MLKIPHNIKALIVYLVSFLLLVSATLYIGYAATTARRHMQRDVVVVMPVINDVAHMFNPLAVEEWAENYPGAAETERIINQVILNPPNTGFARMSVTGRDYFQIAHMSFISGGPWQNDNDHAIIICEYMAWALYGAMDVVGLTVWIGDTEHTVVGVVETEGSRDGVIQGFAWMPRVEAAILSNILYIKPYNYDVLTARLDAEGLLYHLNLHHQNYVITDINSYINSIALRGQVLLALCAVIFVLFASRWAYKLFCIAKDKTGYIIAAVSTASAIAAAAFFFSTLNIDLWLPTFVGEGFSGYARLFFNTGLLAPEVYLPASLVALLNINLRANVAFGIGLAGVLVMGVVRVVSESRD